MAVKEHPELAAAEEHKALGPMLDNPMAVIFGTEFKDFFSPIGIVGQVRVKGDRCDLLSVLALKPGRGHFKKFLKALKRDFATITVMHITNRKLAAYLSRVDFRRTTWREADGELVPAMIWHRSQPAPSPSPETR